MNKIFLTLSCASLILAGCGDASNKAGTSLVEKTIEAATGNKVDALDVNHIEDNHAVVDVTIGDENLQDHFKKGFGSITASKETIAITIAQVDNGQDNILIGFTGKDLTALRPIAGKMVKDENDGFTFSIMKVTENGGMEALMSFEAEGEIVSLQKDKIVIKVKGKIGSSADVESPEKWKFYEGTITLNYPVFQSLGSEKENFLY